MSIKDYPTEELLAELTARVRTDSPLYDPQELRDMLIKSESECAELRAQVERLTNDYSLLQSELQRKETYIKALEVANDNLTQHSSGLRSELKAERDTSNQRLTEIYDRARKAEKERDAIAAQLCQAEDFLRLHNSAPARISKLLNQRKEIDALGKAYRSVVSERDALQARIDAGVMVYRTSNEEWTERKYAGSGASGLLIDIEYMHPDDDRNGEADRNAYRTTDLDAALTLDIEAVERKKRADGSTTPRTGERRKFLEQRFTNPERGIEFWMDESNLLHDEHRDPSGANERRKA